LLGEKVEVIKRLVERQGQAGALAYRELGVPQAPFRSTCNVSDAIDVSTDAGPGSGFAAGLRWLAL